MELEVIHLSSGKGICIPDSVINAFGINDKIILETRKNEIVIKAAREMAQEKTGMRHLKK